MLKAAKMRVHRWRSNSEPLVNIAQFGSNEISMFIKLSMPLKCVNFNVENLRQYLRYKYEFVLWVRITIFQILITNCCNNKLLEL